MDGTTRGCYCRGVQTTVKTRQECSKTNEEVVVRLLVVLGSAIMLRALRHLWRPRKTLPHLSPTWIRVLFRRIFQAHVVRSAQVWLDSWRLDDGCGTKVTSSLRFLAGAVDLAYILFTLPPHLLTSNSLEQSCHLLAAQPVH